MKGSLISCIVPVYNGDLFLAEAVRSILAQTYRAIEVLVVDDGSTDRTADVLESLGDVVRTIRQHNSGAAAARNRGIAASKGDFCAFLDADDLWHPEMLARLMARFHARPELDACVAHYQNYWDAGLPKESLQSRDQESAHAIPGYATPVWLVRRALFTTTGMFDEGLLVNHNAEWWLRVAEAGAVVELLPDILTYRRLHADNLTRRMAAVFREEFIHFVKATLESRRHRTPERGCFLDLPGIHQSGLLKEMK